MKEAYDRRRAGQGRKGRFDSYPAFYRGRGRGQGFGPGKSRGYDGGNTAWGNPKPVPPHGPGRAASQGDNLLATTKPPMPFGEASKVQSHTVLTRRPESPPWADLDPARSGEEKLSSREVPVRTPTRSEAT